MHRTALDPAGVRLAPPWTSLRVVAATGSTNVDLLEGTDVAPGTVLATEHQTHGRGRLDRGWSSPPRAGLAVSVRLEPPTPNRTWTWLPLLAGLALRDAVVAATGLPAGVKWPNDLLLDRRKAAGVLVQAAGPVVVIGVGLNVTLTEQELPVATATSLLLAGAPDPDRTALLDGLLHELGRRYLAWCAAGGDATAGGLRADYLAACTSIGARLEVTLAGGAVVAGTGTGIGPGGQLELATADGPLQVAAGDVVHAALR